MTGLRLLGAVLVVLAGAGLGLGRAAALRSRVSALSGLLAALTLLRGEIVERRTPMSEIAARLAREGPEPCRDWFARLAPALEHLDMEPLAAAWGRTLAETDSLPLQTEARESLGLLGLSLGRFDAPEQAGAIDRCLRELEALRRRAAEEAREQGRLYTGLGLAAGLMLAIVLL